MAEKSYQFLMRCVFVPFRSVILFSLVEIAVQSEICPRDRCALYGSNCRYWESLLNEMGSGGIFLWLKIKYF